MLVEKIQGKKKSADMLSMTVTVDKLKLCIASVALKLEASRCATRGILFITLMRKKYEDMFSIQVGDCWVLWRLKYCTLISIRGSNFAVSWQVVAGGQRHMFEVGNGEMTYQEYCAHFSIWALIKVRLYFRFGLCVLLI